MNRGDYVYHRYVPRGNGTYERQVVEDRAARRPVIPAQPVSQPVCPTAEEPPCQPRPKPWEPCRESRGPGNLLQQFLPKGLDCGDLLVLAILLLLLIDSDEDDLLPVLVAAAVFLFF